MSESLETANEKRDPSKYFSLIFYLIQGYETGSAHGYGACRIDMNMENGSETQFKVSPQKPFDLVESVLRHWLKVLVFGSVLFVLCLPVCLLKKQPFFKTEGRLLISPESTTFMAKADENSISSHYNSFVKTQVERISDQEHLEKAVRTFEGPLKDVFLPNGIPVSTAATILGRQITVSVAAGTHFIVVSIEGKQPEGLAEAVNRLMTLYIEGVREEIEGLDSRRLKYLEDERGQIQRQIDEYTKQYADISQKTGTIYFREGTTVYNTAIESIEREYIKAYSQRVEKENQLMAARRDAEILKTFPLDASVEDLIQKSKTGEQMDLHRFQQIESLKNSIEGLSDGNPDKALIEEKIRGIARSSEQSKTELKGITKRILHDIRDAQLKEKIVRAESEFEAVILAEESIKKKRDAILTEKTLMSQQLLKGQKVEEKLTNLHTQLNRIEDRINLLKLEAKAPGRIMLSNEARKPTEPEGSNLKKLIVLSFLLAFGGMSGLAIIFDVKDDRIRSKKEVLYALGASTSWPISNYLLTRDKNTPFSRVTLDDSSNVVSKAIHSLAIKLNQERRSNGAKLTVLTGVDAASGTSEILINVAYAITKQCKKVIIVDSNMVNPGFTRILNLSETLPGLTDFLRGRVDLKSCVVSCEERQIDVIPCGEILSLNDINKIDRSNMFALFSILKKEYDYILVDSCPVLVSDFTEFLAVNADIVALVVQGDRSNYKALHMVGTIFSRLKVPAVAVVLNWGAPRYPSAFQVTVSRMLKPIQKRLEVSPRWSARHGQPAETDPASIFNRKMWNLLKKIMKLKSIDRHFFISLGLFLLLGAGGIAAANLQNKPLMEENNETHPIIFSSPLPPLPAPVEESAGPTTSASQPPGYVTVEAMEEANTRMQSPPDQKAGIRGIEGAFMDEESWILACPRNAFSIQLMGSPQKEELIRFAASREFNGKIACFRKRRLNEDWYVLLYGIFSDKKQAMEALSILPSSYKTASPWIRSFKEIQAEIKALMADKIAPVDKSGMSVQIGGKDLST